jgi:hypothetical protein
MVRCMLALAGPDPEGIPHRVRDDNNNSVIPAQAGIQLINYI